MSARQLHTLVILRREDAEGSQNTQLEILRYAQDDGGGMKTS
jgi:hypothetical protein